MENKINELTSEQRLKVATFIEVRKVVEEVGENLQFAFSKQSMDLIAELVWRRLKVNASDLEAFAKHAKRSTVNVEDVKLLARRNNVLKEYLTEMADEMKSKKDQQKKKPSTTKKDSVLPPKAAADPFMEGVPGSSKDNQFEEEVFETKFNPAATPPHEVGYRSDSPILLSD